MCTTDGGVASKCPQCWQYLNREHQRDTAAEIQQHVGKSLFKGNAVLTKL